VKGAALVLASVHAWLLAKAYKLVLVLASSLRQEWW
jgi:hypothetical protein